MRSAEQPFIFGKRNEFYPARRNPNPSRATLWCWKSHFFMQTVTAEHSSTSRQVEVEAPGLPWAPSLPSMCSWRNPRMWGWASTGTHRAHVGKRTVLWQTPSCKRWMQLSTKNTLPRIKVSMLPWIVLVLAYINVAEGWSSVRILPMWNLRHKQSNLRFTYKSNKMLLGQI